MDPTVIAVVTVIVAIVFGGIGWYYQHKTLQATKAAAEATNAGEPLPPSPSLPQLPSFNQVEERYRKHLVDMYQFLDFKGIVQLEKIPIRLPLETLFVSLRARPVFHEEDAEADRVAGRPLRLMDMEQSIREKMALRSERSQPGSIVELLKKRPGAVLLGDPGSGKSTVLKHLALLLATGSSLSSKPLPIIVPVAAYATALSKRGELSLQDYLAEYYRSVRGITDDLTEVFSSSLSSGRAVILLDGLDEVTDLDNRVFVTERVQDFYNWHRGKGNRFVITSRLVGYNEAPLTAEGLDHFVLLDFNRDEIGEFVRRWCSAFESASRGESAASQQAAEEERAKLTSAIFSNSSVERLAANPLLLTILALIHRQGTELPRRRVELYELYLKTLIGSWARARNLDGRPIGAMDDVEAIKLLSPLAYWMHAEKPSGTAREHELETHIAKYFTVKRGVGQDKAEDEARHFLNDIRRYAGLLTERGDRAFGFVHLTFEEYLAGREIVLQGQIDKKRSIDLLSKHLLDPAWHEVILLAIGYVSIVAKEEDTAALLVRGLLQEGLDPEYAGQNVVIAGECLRDIGIEGVGKPTWDFVLAKLQQILQDNQMKVHVRWQAGELLGSLGDPRLTGYEQVPELIPIGSGQFTMGTDPEHIESLVSQIQTVTLPADSEWVRDYWISSLRSEAPQHECKVRSFAIGRFPITNGQYKCFVAANPGLAVPTALNDRARPYAWDEKSRCYPQGKGNFPVVLVSWEEATSYCKWLSAITGRAFRLPTEVEWEYASRGKDGRLYPWGNDWDPLRANTIEQGAKGTVAVGCYPDGSSTFGAADTIGQVWEWTSTAWGKSSKEPDFAYPYKADEREHSLPDLWRLVRGGSWDDAAAFARCASRGPNTPAFRSHYIGFRIVEELESTDVSAENTTESRDDRAPTGSQTVVSEQPSVPGRTDETHDGDAQRIGVEE
jgi:formylglycine-generating enzyme required for sulfatase activity/energy-coupling factor transporter ATP-binding protein EcfA2